MDLDQWVSLTSEQWAGMSPEEKEAVLKFEEDAFWAPLLDRTFMAPEE